MSADKADFAIAEKLTYFGPMSSSQDTGPSKGVARTNGGSLKAVLICKIALTLLFWALPLLVFPSTLLGFFITPLPEPLIYLRLLGLAYLALTVAYIGGLVEAFRGGFPMTTVLMGLVSNGGAAILLLVYLLSEAVQPVLWASWLVVTLITCGLLHVLFNRRD
ncbi:MAG: hypothetical protein AAFV38_12315 [Pseudomonadota bacterium]